MITPVGLTQLTIDFVIETVHTFVTGANSRHVAL